MGHHDFLAALGEGLLNGPKPDAATLLPIAEYKRRKTSADIVIVKVCSVFTLFLLQTGRCRQRTTSRYCCRFPFIYKGRRYNRCTKKNHNRPWCAMTSNYDRDKKWGNCAGKRQYEQSFWRENQLY